jgi:hypothetical protein
MSSYAGNWTAVGRTSCMSAVASAVTNVAAAAVAAPQHMNWMLRSSSGVAANAHVFCCCYDANTITVLGGWT